MYGPLELIKTSQFRRYNAVFWLSIASLAYVQDMLSYLVTKGYILPGCSAVYLLGWAIWAILTPFVVKLAVRFPVISSSFRSNLWRHLLLAVIVALSIEAIEASFILLVYYVFWEIADVQNMLLTYLFYTFHIRLIIYFFIVTAASAVDYFSRVQRYELQAVQLQSKLVEAQLKALKMQIQPHFLFNTLHSIVGLILKTENKKAVGMLTRLSDLLRKTLDISEEHLISLQREFDTVSLYLKIQQVRFSDRLKIRVNPPKDLWNVQVPPFILQPLVENAIKHGFSPYSQTCEIEVTAEKVNGRLRMIVLDDGVGLAKPCTGSKGIGIKNVQSRLKELFGSDYSLSICNREIRGAIATIEIPLIEEHGQTNQELSGPVKYEIEDSDS
jgi:two-component system, LytTR family, sensor kinase